MEVTEFSNSLLGWFRMGVKPNLLVGHFGNMFQNVPAVTFIGGVGGNYIFDHYGGRVPYMSRHWRTWSHN